jgi:hypothetical protein
LIKEKSRNRINRLEDSQPKYGGDEDGIPFTDEAVSLLVDWEAAFERLDGQTLYYKPLPESGIIRMNIPPEGYSIVVNETLWIRTMGRCLALAASKGEGDTGINEDIARAMIVVFQEYGITI